MEAGKVTEFIDNLTIQDEMVRYEGYTIFMEYDLMKRRTCIIQVLTNSVTI